METKALFLDLDGTLLDDKKKITDGNRAAIRKVLDMGHKVIINTGRPLSSARLQAQALDLTDEGCYLVAYNGGVLYDSFREKEIFHESIPLDLVFKVFDEANRRGIHIQTYSETAVIVEPRCDDAGVRRYCSLTNIHHEVIQDIRMFNMEPVKILTLDYDNPAPLEDFRKWMESWAYDCLDTFFSCDQYLEMVPKGLNKGTALRQMASLLNIPIENTIAVGDAQNDIPMIEAAHVGVCMCNGNEEVKGAAGYITENDNNHDGIKEVIEKFVL